MPPVGFEPTIPASERSRLRPRCHGDLRAGHTKHNYREHEVAFNTPFSFSGRDPIKDLVGFLIMTYTLEKRR